MNRSGLACVLLMMILFPSGCHRHSRASDPRLRIAGVDRADSSGTAYEDRWQQPAPVVSRAITEKDVERMEDLYNECRYEECLVAAEEIVSHPTAKSKYRAMAWFYKGVILVLEAQEDQATRCFRQARRLDDDLKADKRRFKPAVVRCFQSSIP